jgi:hypothetical protein
MVGPANRRWRRFRARDAVITVLVCSMLMAACTGSHRPRASGPVEVDGTTRQSLQVGGTDEDRLLLAVEPGDVDGSGSITSGALEQPPPSWPWFIAAGPPRDLQVRARLAHPLTLSFAAGQHHLTDLPLVLHKAGTGDWSPVAVGDRGGRARAERRNFSPYLPGWADASRWFDDLIGTANRMFRGRTTPPSCVSLPPSWAEFTQPTLDILLSCASTNVAGKVPRVEVMVKNNRGFTQEITIPSGVAYAAAQDQPEPLRRLVRFVAGGRDVVLLPPGNWLTMGFTRPESTVEVTVTPRLSRLALLTQLVLQLADLAGGKAAGLSAATVVLKSCFGSQLELLSGMPRGNLAGVTKLVTEAAECLGGIAGEPEKAVAIAQQVVSLETSRPLAIVQSDAAFNPLVEERAGKLLLVGKLLKGLELTRLAYIVWESVGEELGRALVDNDPASVRLALTAPPTLCGRSTGCRQVATVDVDGDGRPDQVAVARLADSADGQQSWALRVLTARGRLGVIRHGPDTIYGEPFFGAAEIDGVPGVELLLRMSSGPHSQWFQMYTWRGSRLTVERNPDIPDGYQRYGWVVDSAFSEAVGVTCDRSGGPASITLTGLTPNGQDVFTNPNARYSGDMKMWRWSDGRWVANGTRQISMSAGTPEFKAVAGWHCLGLPRGTG